jgi:membrane-associated protein
MLALLDFANDWVKRGGLVVLGIIIFAESGLLLGFFLPGDSLLFFGGFLASSAGKHVLPGGLPAVAAVAFAAAVIGDQVGYVFGRRVGPSLFTRERSRLFNPANVEKAQAFFDKHGPKTIVLARFVPIVRTFAPFVAGVGKMSYGRFMSFNVVGGVLWVAICVAAGYFFGNLPVVKDNFSLVILAIIFVSILPMAVEIVRSRRASPAAR